MVLGEMSNNDGKVRLSPLSLGLSRDEAISRVTGFDEFALNDTMRKMFPMSPEVIVLGGLEGNLYKFCELFSPKSVGDIDTILGQLPLLIVGDDVLSNQEMRSKCNFIFRDVLYVQYKRILSKYSGLTEFVNSEGTRLWFDDFLPKIRAERLPKIRKEHNEESYQAARDKVSEVYSLTDRDLDLLTYFCSHCKQGIDLDSSKNVCLWIWSKEQNTGKTTISQYITAFLNGEMDRNIDEFNSTIETEMQTRSRFAIPKATTNVCTMLDEISLDAMLKNYTAFKNIITQRGCEVEYKYISRLYPKQANFKYICTSNYSPEFAIADETERRIITIKWTTPKKKLDFPAIKQLWYEFVLECNWDKERLFQFYDEEIKTTPQTSDVQSEMIELSDFLTYGVLANASDAQGFFTTLRVKTIPEISLCRFSRKFIKDTLVKQFGEPDKKGRWNLNNINFGYPDNNPFVKKEEDEEDESRVRQYKDDENEIPF